MDRVLAANQATATATFAVDDTLLDSVSAVTVTVTNEAGTTVASGLSASHVAPANSGTYTVSLSAALCANPDILTLTWTGDRVMTTQVEVVGGRYFDLHELRQLPDMDDTTRYSTHRALAARSWIEGVIDRVCGTSFVARYHHDHLSADPHLGLRVRPIVLRAPYARQILGINVAGVALDNTGLASYEVGYGGTLQTVPGGSALGPGIVDIFYTAGWSTSCPDDLAQVAMQAARFRLVSVDGKSGVPSRALSITNEFGNVRLASAGQNAPTGIPDVDSVIMDWADKVRVPAIA